MKRDSKIILYAVLVAVVLNIVLPLVLKPFATEEEVKPSNGAASLSLKGQFMHMMVHHNQVILTSSAIVGLIVAISVAVALKL
tara:strand:+ start:81 stop:329 length:249 start_codon:yes stop_codon:yes gene_type:complete